MARKRKRKPGRPKSADPLSTYVKIRCKPEDKAAWVKAAGGSSHFSDWARTGLNQLASK